MPDEVGVCIESDQRPGTAMARTFIFVLSD